MPHSYFAMFNLEPRFSLPAGQPDAAYRELAARVHPDRHTLESPAEQRRTLALATDANEAYRTLKRPLLRACHLLRLRGVDANDAAAACGGDFLALQMEWRENLAELRARRDVGGLRGLQAVVDECAARLHALLAVQLDVDLDDLGAVRSVQQLMFVEKVLADIGDTLGHLES